MSSPQQKVIGYLLLFILVIGLDQGIKIIAPQFFPIYKNFGIVLGLFGQNGFYLSILGLGVISFLVFKNHLNSGSAILLGGAVSNIIDRLRYGYVLDYIDLKILPVFNLADLAIVFGMILLIMELTRKGKSYGKNTYHRG